MACCYGLQIFGVCVSVEERLTKRTLKRESGIWLIVFIFIFMDC